MNSLSGTDELQPPTAQVASVPTPLRHTQLAIGLTALLGAVVQVVQGEAGDLYIASALLGTAMTYYALRWHILARAPLSSLALIGCGVCNFYLPLVITTFEGKPITFELQRPDLTFGFNLLAFVVLIAVHIIYLQSSLLQSTRLAISRKILQPLGLFIVPSPAQLFVLGTIGLGAMVFIYFALGLTTDETFGSVGLKALEGLFWLAYAPYLILLYPLLGRGSRSAGSYAVPILLFSSAMLIIGSAQNSRTAIFIGITGIILGVVLGGWLGIVPANLFRPRNLVLGCIVAILLIPVATQLGSSMLEARGDRKQVSPAEVLLITFSAFLSGESNDFVRSYLDESTTSDMWHGGDEYYLDSMLFGRLCNLKFADNTLTIVAGLDAPRRASIAERELEWTLSILPQPVLDLMGSKIDKQANRGSMGSFVYYLSSGRPELLEQLATGSYLASGWASLGWLAPFVLALLALALFIMLDSFVILGPGATHAVFSAVATMGLFGTFTLFTSAAGAPESVAGLLAVLLREIPQQALVYGAVFFLVRQLVPQR
jgi:hypothetical protein